MAWYMVSIGVYFLLISSFITFRMKARYYVLLAGIISFFILVGSQTIGEISIVLMYFCVMLLLAYPVFVISGRLISKQIGKIRQRISLVLPRRIMFILAADVILCMVIFIMQVLFERRLGTTSAVLRGNIILYFYIIPRRSIHSKSHFQKEYAKKLRKDWTGKVVSCE